jgi:hypothetical protein
MSRTLEHDIRKGQPKATVGDLPAMLEAEARLLARLPAAVREMALRDAPDRAAAFAAWQAERAAGTDLARQNISPGDGDPQLRQPLEGASSRAASRAAIERRHARRAATCAEIEAMSLAELVHGATGRRAGGSPSGEVDALSHGTFGLGRFELYMSARAHAAALDVSGEAVAGELERLADTAPELARRAWFAAHAIGTDGHAARHFAGHGSDARRARAIALVAVAIGEADRLMQRPSQCMIARIVSPPGCGYRVCRDCGTPHVSKRTLSHWDPLERDTLDSDIGYLQALWLTGAIDSWQWRHPAAIEQHCYPHEVGRSGWPVSHYTIATVAPLEDCESPIVAEVLGRALAVDLARSVVSLVPRLRPRAVRRAARDGQERLAELRRAIAPT